MNRIALSATSRGLFFRSQLVARQAASARWASSSASEENKEEESSVRASGQHEFPNDPVGPGLVDSIGLTDPTRWVPLSILGFGGLTAAGMYHWNAESQVLGVFLLATGVAYAKGGDAIAKYFDTEKYNLADEIKKAEDEALASDKELLGMYSATVGKDKHFEFFHETHKEIVKEENAAKTQEAKRAVRDKYERVLKAYADIQDRKVEGVRSNLVEGSTAYVREGFVASSDEMKAKSLDAALAALADPSKASAPAELGDLYAQYFAEQKAKYEKLASEPQPLSQEDQDKYVEDKKRILQARGFGELGDKELETAIRSKMPATMTMSL